MRVLVLQQRSKLCNCHSIENMNLFGLQFCCPTFLFRLILQHFKHTSSLTFKYHSDEWSSVRLIENFFFFSVYSSFGIPLRLCEYFRENATNRTEKGKKSTTSISLLLVHSFDSVPHIRGNAMNLHQCRWLVT